MSFSARKPESGRKAFFRQIPDGAKSPGCLTGRTTAIRGSSKVHIGYYSQVMILVSLCSHPTFRAEGSRGGGQKIEVFVRAKTMKPARVFIHGLESSGRGAKGMYFRDRYKDMIIEDFAGFFKQRMEKLESLLSGERDLILVGSSYGGLMAATYACLHEDRILKLILLAPALHLDEYGPWLNKKLFMPITIFHGIRDEVVPLDAIRDVAARLYANHTFHVMEDDHSLNETFTTYDWDNLLSIQTAIS